MGNNRVQLAIVIHNHQPVGNFGYVIHQACDMAYLPFLRKLLEYPKVRIGLHTSGCLWEWLEWNRPEYGKLVDELLRRGQVELVGGGMYEPILPVLPETDALWQLNRMNRFVESRFGVKPTGMWCPERVWEPHLPALIAQAGLRYTLLDDFHFRASVEPAKVSSDYFLSTHAGSEIALLPISKKLRYTIPFQDVSETIEYLQELAQSNTQPPLAVFGDDGEKFGVWPDTYEWVYEKGWLDKFFAALSDNSEWLEIVLPGEVISTRMPADTVFLPCASYAEMGEWSRISPEATEEDPPGFWRNYFHKYPESYAMYEHALAVSAMLQSGRKLALPEWVLAEAADDLGRGQCNCAYWHGVFGGLYLNYLRQAVHHHLLKAEDLLRKHLPAPPQAEQGARHPLTAPCYKLSAGDISITLDPSRGLCAKRIDDLDTAFCWSDVLARRREAYHAKLKEAPADAAEEHASIHDRVIVKEEGLLDLIVPDPHVRLNFNTFFTNITDPELLVQSPTNAASPLVRQHDDFHIPVEHVLTKRDFIAGRLDYGTFMLRKSYTATPNAICCEVQVAQGLPPADDISFAMELNLTVLTDQAPDRYLRFNGQPLALNQLQVCDGPGVVKLGDGWRHRSVSIECSNAVRVICYPVYTVSSSEGGFERTYQGSCILVLCHPMALLQGIKCALTFAIEKADDA